MTILSLENEILDKANASLEILNDLEKKVRVKFMHQNMPIFKVI